MQQLDWIVIGLFFLVMVIIGLWSFKEVDNSGDFFIAGGKLNGGSPVFPTIYPATVERFLLPMRVWHILMALPSMFGGLLQLLSAYSQVQYLSLPVGPACVQHYKLNHLPNI